MDIKKLDRAALKSYFVKNAVPTESNFADLIDGMINQKEDGLVRLAGEPLSIQADGNDSSQKKAINFYRSFTDAKPAWTLSLNPRVDPNNPATARLGWSVGDADGNSKLFIDQNTGNLGVGTVDPGIYRLNVSGPSLFTDGFFKGKVGIGATSAAERLDVNGRVKAGALSIGPWPANEPAYVFVGVNTLDQAAAGNYALLQGITEGPGRTFLNSPVDIRFRINNADQMVLSNVGNLSIGTADAAGKLHVQTGSSGAWERFVVKSTNLWGDGNSQYVTIGEGGAAGIMFYNPHVVWYAPEARASIRFGRSGGVSTGHWWDVGVRPGNMFSILDGQSGAFGLSINEIGTVKVNVLQLGEKWRLSGVGDHEGNDKWLRLKNTANNNYYGGLASYELWSNGGLVQGSDVRLKKDVEALRQAPEDILKLRGVRFRWKESAHGDGYAMGLIAQEVEELFPEVVSDGPEGLKGINYSALIAPMIEAMKQQQVHIDQLRTEIRILKGR